MPSSEAVRSCSMRWATASASDATPREATWGPLGDARVGPAASGKSRRSRTRAIDTPQHYSNLVENARGEKERAERELADRSAAFRAELADREVSLEAIRAALPAHTALVSFARYDQTVLTGSGTGLQGVANARRGRRGMPAYVAHILRADRSDISVVPLGSARTLDRLVAGWHDQATGILRASTAADAENLPLCRRAAPTTGLGSAQCSAERRRTGLRCSGRCHQPAFVLGASSGSQGLPDRRGTSHSLPHRRARSGHDRFSIADEQRPAGHCRCRIRRCDCLHTIRDTATGEVSWGNHEEVDCRASSRLRRFTVAREFEPLDGTTAEVRDIARLWAGSPARVLDGQHASEREFKRAAPGKRVLHLATHGFFLSGRCDGPATGGTRGVGGLTTEPRSRSIPDRTENPLLLSGFALAGANRRATAGPNDEDGILMAEEVASLISREWTGPCCPRATPAWASSGPAKGCSGCAVRSRLRAPVRSS